MLQTHKKNPLRGSVGGLAGYLGHGRSRKDLIAL